MTEGINSGARATAAGLDPAPDVRQGRVRARVPVVTIAVLLVAVAVVFWGQHFIEEPEPPEKDRQRHGDATMQLQLLAQGKVLIGQAMAGQLAGAPAAAIDPRAGLEKLEQATLDNRDGAAARALAALHLFLFPDDIAGALAQLESAPELQPGEPGINALVRQEINDPGTLSQEQMDELQFQMHWFAHPLLLAREAPDHPERARLMVQVMMLMVFAGAAMLFVLGGFLLGVVLLGLAGLASARQGGQVGKSSLFAFDSSTGGGGGRAQIWAFITYIGIMGAPILSYLAGIHLPGVGVAAFVLSVFAGLFVALTFSRGTVRERRRALGLHSGRGIFREIGSGVIGYCCVLPIAACGALVSWASWRVSQALQQGDAADTVTGHPVGELFFDAPAIVRFGLLLLASVGAPLIEETMFRGVLHRGLRRSLSLPLAAGFGAACFAAVHPQDIIVLPVLMALAVGFALVREWRDSLIAPMVAHGLHNGMLITGLWLVTM